MNHWDPRGIARNHRESGIYNHGDSWGIMENHTEWWRCIRFCQIHIDSWGIMGICEICIDSLEFVRIHEIHDNLRELSRICKDLWGLDLQKFIRSNDDLWGLWEFARIHTIWWDLWGFVYIHQGCRWNDMYLQDSYRFVDSIILWITV